MSQALQMFKVKGQGHRVKAMVIA